MVARAEMTCILGKHTVTFRHYTRALVIGLLLIFAVPLYADIHDYRLQCPADLKRSPVRHCSGEIYKDINLSRLDTLFGVNTAPACDDHNYCYRDFMRTQASCDAEFFADIKALCSGPQKSACQKVVESVETSSKKTGITGPWATTYSNNGNHRIQSKARYNCGCNIETGEVKHPNPSTQHAIAEFAQLSAGNRVLAGNFLADKGGKDELLILPTGIHKPSSCGWDPLPVVHIERNDKGTMNLQFAQPIVSGSRFMDWSTNPYAHAATGDFNADGLTDIALAGGREAPPSKENWRSVPFAFSKSAPTFSNINQPADNYSYSMVVSNVTGSAGDPTAPNLFASIAAGLPQMRLVGGLFNPSSNGINAQLALFGNLTPNTNSVPVANVSPEGILKVDSYTLISQTPKDDFNLWAMAPRVQTVSGNFTGSGKTEIALVGGLTWKTIPLAVPKQNTFAVSNPGITDTKESDFSTWSWNTTKAMFVVGDFNGDKRDDIALISSRNWASIPFVSYNLETHQWAVTNNILNSHLGTYPNSFAYLSFHFSGAQLVAGNFDNKFGDDIAIVGVAGRSTLPVAWSTRNGGFTMTND